MDHLSDLDHNEILLVFIKVNYLTCPEYDRVVALNTKYLAKDFFFDGSENFLQATI